MDININAIVYVPGYIICGVALVDQNQLLV